MSLFKRIPIFVLSIILIVAVMTSCAQKNDDIQTPSDDIPAVSIDENTDNSTEDISDAEKDEYSAEIQEPEPEPQFFSNLTGLPCDESLITSRPVAIMINNIKNAIPQHGIADADILYECIVEGGITRLLAVYEDYSKLPLIGSVRSSRDYYIDIAQSHDAIYAHCGGSPDAYSAISSRNIDNIDGVNGSYTESQMYWKDKDRVRKMGYEHASMTNGQSITNTISALGFRTQLQSDFKHPLLFSKNETETSGTDAIKINIMYSYYAQSYFDYNPYTKTYDKGQYGSAHVDANIDNVTPISFKNVIVLGASYKLISGDDKNRLDLFFTGQGNGYYFANGSVKNIVWKKADRQSPYSLYEEDGVTPLVLNPGKSYIGITDGLSCVSISSN